MIWSIHTAPESRWGLRAALSTAQGTQVAKKKPKAKLDPLLAKHKAAYERYDKLAVEYHELANQARQEFAELAAKLAGVAVGDYIAVKAYSRETPMIVLSFNAQGGFRREYELEWRICCHQVKADGTKHNGHSHRMIAGETDPADRGYRGEGWRKITKLEASKLAKEQRV